MMIGAAAGLTGYLTKVCLFLDRANTRKRPLGCAQGSDTIRSTKCAARIMYLTWLNPGICLRLEANVDWIVRPDRPGPVGCGMYAVSGEG
jgi:hypothetical protein